MIYGQSLLKLNQQNEAIYHFEEVKSLLEQSFYKKDTTYVSACIQTANIFQDRKEYGRALSEYCVVEATVEENPECLEKLKYALVLSNMSTLYAKNTQDIEHALLLSEKSLKIRLEELPEVDPSVQQSYELNADLNLKLGKLN